MALRDQLFSQPEMVVDLAVEGDGEGPVLVVHRLGAILRKVDDREAAVTERRRAAAEVPAPVGSPMRDDLRHPAQQRLVGETILVAIHEAADAAHAVTP